MEMRSAHIPRLCGSATFVLLLGMMQRGHIVEAQEVSVKVDVTLRNRMDPGQVVWVDCLLNDTSINPQGFLTGGGPRGNTISIFENLMPDDAIYCDFKMGFVAKDWVQVTVQCSVNGTCSPMSVDFTNKGAYFNLMSGNQPAGLPDIPWSSLLPPPPRCS